MIDWTAILTASTPTIVLAIALIVVMLFFRKRLRRVNTRWGSADLGDRPGISAGYVIELIIEVAAILKGREDLRDRRRRIIKQAIRQWRNNVAIYFREELDQSGTHVDGLYRNPIYRYLMSVMEIVSHELVGVVMTHCEKNGFDELDQEAERAAYVMQKVRELEARIAESIQRDYVVSENAIVTQNMALEWLEQRKPLTDALWSSMYRQLIAVSLDEKMRLLSYAERITAKGEAAGLLETEIDHIRNMLRRDLMEGV